MWGKVPCSEQRGKKTKTADIALLGGNKKGGRQKEDSGRVFKKSQENTPMVTMVIIKSNNGQHPWCFILINYHILYINTEIKSGRRGEKMFLYSKVITSESRKSKAMFVMYTSVLPSAPPLAFFSNNFPCKHTVKTF